MKRLIPFLLVLSILFAFTPAAYAAVTPDTLNDNISGIYKQLAVTGIPVGKSSKVYFVDPANGYDTNSGWSIDKPMKSVAAAFAKTVANRNDVVVMIGGPTADAVTGTIAWNKSYTHLVGLSADLPGAGQRCRVTASAALDLDAVIVVSGNGCIVKNVQFFNGSDLATCVAAAAVVSGSRCHFQNVFFAGMGHATSAGNASGVSLAVTGEENAFVRCTIGLDTILRSAANTELVVSGTDCKRLKFIDCEFNSQCNTAGKFLVALTDDAAPNTLTFENCVFNNFKSNNGATGTALGNAISDAATAYHAIVLKGSCLLVGVTGWADVVTYIMTPGVNGAGTYGVGTAPTT